MGGPGSFPEPDAVGDQAQLVLRLIDFHRGTALRKARSLPAEELRTTRLPSGWSPLELLWHLLHMERRWIVWGFLARPVPDPWSDHHPDRPGLWVVPDDLDVDRCARELDAVAEVTREVLSGTPLTAVAAVGGRFASDPPTLGAVALHVLQEYARHVGHLDIACELAGGDVGE